MQKTHGITSTLNVAPSEDSNEQYNGELKRERASTNRNISEWPDIYSPTVFPFFPFRNCFLATGHPITIFVDVAGTFVVGGWRTTRPADGGYDKDYRWERRDAWRDDGGDDDVCATRRQATSLKWNHRHRRPIGTPFPRSISTPVVVKYPRTPRSTGRDFLSSLDARPPHCTFTYTRTTL